MINLNKEQQDLKQKIPKIEPQEKVLYQNQIDLSEEFMKCDWLDKDSLIMAETQVGKTGMMFAIMQQIVDYSFLKNQGEVENNYEFFLWSPPDNNLELQTKKRVEDFIVQRPDRDIYTAALIRRPNKNLSLSLFGGGSYNNFLSSGRDSLISKAKDRIKLEMEKRFIVFVDEAHYGQGRESKFDKFEKFCKKMGNVTFVYITATPSPFLGEKKTVGELRTRYNLLYLAPAPCYYSLGDCFKDGRIIDIEPSLNLSKKVNFEKWIDEIVVKDLIQERKNKNGVFIVRLPNTTVAEKLQDAINKQNDLINKDYGVSVGSEVFNSGNGNIAQLEKYLKNFANKGPNRIDLALIINALGQGKTMDNSNIIGWYEYLNVSKKSQKYSNEARLIQSIGRNLGNNPARKDYPIWTHQSTVEIAIKQNNEMALIACSGIKNNHVISHLSQQTSTHVSSTGEKPIETLDLKGLFFFATKKDLDKHLHSNGIRSNYTLKTSGNYASLDICGVITGASRHTTFKCGLENDGYWVAHFDSMHPLHQKSWNNMGNKFQQKIVLIPIIKTISSTTANKSAQNI